jgi:hypothetical protein
LHLLISECVSVIVIHIYLLNPINECNIAAIINPTLSWTGTASDSNLSGIDCHLTESTIKSHQSQERGREGRSDHQKASLISRIKGDNKTHHHTRPSSQPLALPLPLPSSLLPLSLPSKYSYPYSLPFIEYHNSMMDQMHGQSHGKPNHRRDRDGTSKERNSRQNQPPSYSGNASSLAKQRPTDFPLR